MKLLKVIVVPAIAVSSGGDDDDNVDFGCDSDYCPAHVTQESDFDFEQIEGGCYKNVVDDFQKTENGGLDTTVHKFSRGTRSSSEDCINYCKTGKTNTIFMNYHYAAIEAGGACYCSASLPKEELDLSECPMTCSGDDTDYCGGTDNHATIYYVENSISKSYFLYRSRSYSVGYFKRHTQKQTILFIKDLIVYTTKKRALTRCIMKLL